MCIEFFKSRLINIKVRRNSIIEILKLDYKNYKCFFFYFIMIMFFCFSICVNEEFILMCLFSLYWIFLYNGLVLRVGKI